MLRTVQRPKSELFNSKLLLQFLNDKPQIEYTEYNSIQSLPLHKYPPFLLGGMKRFYQRELFGTQYSSDDFI